MAAADKTTKKEQAYTRIRDDIFCRKLPPYSKINISQLAAEYDMSVIPVREALTLLENENLVQNIPYRGFMVTGIVFDDFLEYSLIRNEMECLALRYGVAYLTDESLNKTKALQRELEQLYRTGELERYVIVNRQFYKSLYEFAPCGRLQDMIDDLTHKAYHTRSILLLIPNHIENSLREHEQLIAEIEARNPERAAQIMFSHRMETLRVLVQEMKYCLMKPDYQNESVLKDFFSDEALADRSALIGKVEYWNFIFEHLAGDRTDVSQA